MKRKLKIGGVVLAALTFPVGLSGCAVGFTNDGRPVIGAAVGDDGQLDAPGVVAVKGAAGVLGGLFGLPPGVGEALAGGAISVLGFGGIAAREKRVLQERQAETRERAARAEGRHEGWDENELARLRNSGGAGSPGGSDPLAGPA